MESNVRTAPLEASTSPDKLSLPKRHVRPPEAVTVRSLASGTQCVDAAASVPGENRVSLPMMVFALAFASDRLAQAATGPCA